MKCFCTQSAFVRKVLLYAKCFCTQSASIYEGIGERGALVGGFATPGKLGQWGTPVWQWHLIGGWVGPTANGEIGGRGGAFRD
jgi:hypothetical protein